MHMTILTKKTNVLRTIVIQLIQQNLFDIRKVETVVTNGVKRKVSSQVWKQFYQIYEVENNNDIKNWFLCLLCHEPVENNFIGSTTLFIRHQKHCLKEVSPKSFDGGPAVKTNVSAKYVAAIKEASTQYICEDLRPYSAMEGSGLFHLLSAALELGKSYPTMTADDLKRILPSRNTTQRAVQEKLPTIKSMISKDLMDSLATCGGFACTVDLWSDKFRQRTFLAMTAHLNLVADSIIHKRLVIGFKQIEEQSKTTEVVLRYMYDILLDYGLSVQQIEEQIEFISDRGSQFVAMKDIRRSNCFAHIINNIVQAVCNDSAIQPIIDSCRKLVRYVKKTHLNYRNDIVAKSYCKQGGIQFS